MTRDVLNFHIGECVPFSQQACLDAGHYLGLNIQFSSFAKNSGNTKGCFAENNGTFPARLFYGMGGTVEEKNESLTSPNHRPVGHDCLLTGCPDSISYLNIIDVV